MYFVPHFGHAKVYETSIWTPCFQISAKTLPDNNINNNIFQIVTFPKDSVDNMKRMQCIVLTELYYHPGMQNQRRASYFLKR